MEELNSTMQQGFQEIRELKERVKEELQGVQEDINDNLKGMDNKLQGIQQLLSTILSLHYNPGYSPSHPAHSCKTETQAVLQDTTGWRAALNKLFKNTATWRGHVVGWREVG